MKTFRARVIMSGGFISKLQSDTLFGGMCWAWRELAGEAALRDLLCSCREGNPPFVLSDMFPGEYLPRPMLPRRQAAGEMSKEESLKQARQAKQLKGITWYTQDEFLAAIRGKEIIPASKQNPLITAVTLHNTISRLTGTTVDEGGLYELAETFCRPVEKGEEPYLSLYLKITEGWEEHVRSCLELLGCFGVGRRKSVGKGGFTLDGFEPFAEFEKVKEANAFVSLSHFVPAPGDPVDGSYRVTVKYGRLDREHALSFNPFKHPVIMFTPGSFFFTGQKPREFYGCAVEGVAPGLGGAIQGGFAFAVPAQAEGGGSH